MAKIKATAKWAGNSRLIADNGRGHEIVCDLPVVQGGDNAGPTPLELAVMALASCAVTIFANVCRESKIKLERLEVVAEAEKQSGSPRLAGVVIEAAASGNARQQLLEAAWRRTEANCPVLLVYKEQVPMKVRFEAVPEKQ